VAYQIHAALLALFARQYWLMLADTGLSFLLARFSLLPHFDTALDGKC
jgi:hypothetical protein